MTDTTGSLPPAGWYPDPYGAPFERWWDGAGWTEHTNSPAPAAPEPVQYTPPVVEPVAYTPPPLEEPPVASRDPFAGFVSPADAEPSPWPAQPVEPVQYVQPAEPAPYVPYEPEPVAASSPVFGSDLFGQPEPVAPAEPQPASAVNPPSAFDFGFGAIVAGDAAPSNASVPAAAGDDGLFGSWEPNEYVEPPRNSLATAGLALGVVSFFLSAIAGVPGLILSVLGLGRSGRFARDGDGPVGRGKSIAGIALSVIGSAVSIGLILYGLPLLTGTQDDGTADPAADGSSTVDDADLTQNGGIPLEIGDIGTITLADSDAAAIQFTVTAITPNFTCTAAESVTPENGQFVAVAMNFTLSADYLGRMEGGTALHMNQSDWLGFLADENGTQVDSTDAGSSCISTGEQFPAEFAPGTDVSGTIVLDTAADVASISYAPSGVTGLDPGVTRWEWTVPAS